MPGIPLLPTFRITSLRSVLCTVLVHPFSVFFSKTDSHGNTERCSSAHFSILSHEPIYTHLFVFSPLGISANRLYSPQ